MTNEETAVEQFMKRPLPLSAACGCLGPQNDEPLCPCAMKWTEVVDGQLYEIFFADQSMSSITARLVVRRPVFEIEERPMTPGELARKRRLEILAKKATSSSASIF